MKVNGSMFNPPHPGEFISNTYLGESGISGRVLAGRLGVTPSTLQRILVGASGISPEMALRLSIVIGRSPESWLAMQDAFDLWQARQRVNLENLTPMLFDAVS
jgi:addiction module HigA family antidote